MSKRFAPHVYRHARPRDWGDRLPGISASALLLLLAFAVIVIGLGQFVGGVR